LGSSFSRVESNFLFWTLERDLVKAGFIQSAIAVQKRRARILTAKVAKGYREER